MQKHILGTIITIERHSYPVCAHSKAEHEPQRRRANRASDLTVVRATAPCCCVAGAQSAVAQVEKCPYLCECCKERSDGRAIVTKSIASCCPTRSGRRGFPFKGERRYGRDALNNPSGGRIVAKANEADCVAQTPKSKHVRKGEIAFKIQ